MTKLSRTFLLLSLAAFGLALGCSAAEPADHEDPQSTSEALTAPALVAIPSSVDFGRTTVGSVRQVVVTISNRSRTPAINILPPDPYIPPDPYYPPDPYVPPDPYTVLHNPPGDLVAYGSGTMTLAFAPSVAGAFSSTIALRYQDATGANYTLRIPVRGTAY